MSKILPAATYRTPKKCSNCGVAVNELCFCGECEGIIFTPDHCHLCRAMRATIQNSPYLAIQHNVWAAEQKARRTRMGLEGDIGT